MFEDSKVDTVGLRSFQSQGAKGDRKQALQILNRHYKEEVSIV